MAKTKPGAADAAFNRDMRKVHGLQERRPVHPGAISKDDLKPGARIIRYFLDGDKWHSGAYEVISAPVPVPAPSYREGNYFLGGEGKVLVRSSQGRSQEMDLPAMGLLPYRTREGDLWTTKVYCTLQDS